MGYLPLKGILADGNDRSTTMKHGQARWNGGGRRSQLLAHLVGYVLDAVGQQRSHGAVSLESEPGTPLASPRLTDLEDLPPLLITAFEFDPLLDDRERKVAQLPEPRARHRYASVTPWLHPHHRMLCSSGSDHVELARGGQNVKSCS
jgi:hypothetical protein